MSSFCQVLFAIKGRLYQVYHDIFSSGLDSAIINVIATTESIMLRLYILGFLPPELLLEKPTEVSSNSPEERILEICSLTVARLTSNN